MKKILCSIVALMSTFAAMAQVITFERTEHDFGKINEADGRVTTVFTFKNEGMEPLVLSNVRASCGCTTPKWTREPIEPGQKGEITVTYNPNGRPGRFQKTITVTSNSQEPNTNTTRLYIKGEVIPKPAKPVNQYTVQMGELSLKANTVNFGTVKKGEKAQAEVEYANHTDHELAIDLATRPQDTYLLSQVTLPNPQPQQTGKFQFVLNSVDCPLYGPVELTAYVMLAGKKTFTDEYLLKINANIVEDFSALTVAERQNAPIAEFSNVIDLGKIAAGKAAKKNFTIANAGANPLMVRRVYCKDADVQIAAPKSAIKSGKKADTKLVISANQQAGQYSRELIVITNDPQNPVQKVTINWTVE